MKSVRTTFLMALFAALLFACSTQPGASSDEPRKSGQDYSNYQNLAEILRTIPGLNVVGSGNSVRVYMRGVSTIMLETQPLYIVDGMPVGNDYSRANNLVNPMNIASVKVEKSQSKLTLYGQQANHGAILIKTKTSN